MLIIRDVEQINIVIMVEIKYSVVYYEMRQNSKLGKVDLAIRGFR